ncbi:hypothetical protein SAMN04244572_04614 [Azotobacter beijerinckii]|uniref:Uncharacterized protein n=1 Tax=Azotobacter beijerinckii TaxID=170623 RepID=A0A1H7A919_9GAMM|nr:hypothetical protein SAMN04244572_04614 [Azotobacter beijerinckii]
MGASLAASTQALGLSILGAALAGGYLAGLDMSCQCRFEEQPGFDWRKLIFVDETAAATNLARLRGWAPRGERCLAAVPHGHWKTTTFTAGLRVDVSDP